MTGVSNTPSEPLSERADIPMGESVTEGLVDAAPVASTPCGPRSESVSNGGNKPRNDALRHPGQSDSDVCHRDAKASNRGSVP